MLNRFLNLIFDPKIKTGRDKRNSKEAIHKASFIWIVVLAAIYLFFVFISALDKLITFTTRYPR